MQDDDPFRGPRRFGVFELDLRAGELRKHGLRVRLQEQPFQVQAKLLMRHGEVVTREELQKKLWPADTFVNFDHRLNKAINKVRDALCDSAECPRFTETASRRGYRFIAEVKVADASGCVPTPTLFLVSFSFRRDSGRYSVCIGFSLHVASALISFSSSSSELANSPGRNTGAPKHSSPNLSIGTHQKPTSTRNA
jgi:DNA-binding winged helix-turn-helix (wHTH) protein